MQSGRFIGEDAGNAGRHGEISRAWVNRRPLPQRSDRGDAKKLAAAAGAEGFVNLLGEKALDAVIYATAVGECNAAMGRIVAAPTAGASGVLPGVFFTLKKHCGLDAATLQRGMVVAGSIGMVINERASLAGAMGGCQAECGSAAAMAAGAAVSMLGGTPQQVGTAVAVVFKNVLGLVCDPVAGLVEVPCIKRNGACALQALLAAELAWPESAALLML